MSRARQRTKNGCLTCRQKRKKCDEAKPVCIRCAARGDKCIWPLAESSHQLPDPPGSPMHQVSLFATISESSRSQTHHFPGHRLDNHGLAYRAHTDDPNQYALDNTFTRNILVGNFDMAGLDFRMGTSTPVYDVVEPLPKLGLFRRSFSPPADTPVYFVPQNQQYKPSDSKDIAKGESIHLGYVFDEDEQETLNTAEWLPSTGQLIRATILHCDRLCSPGALDSYLAFIVRYCFDPITITDATSLILSRICASESVRLAMMSTANLCHSFLNPSFSLTLQRRAKTLIERAGATLQVELARHDTPTAVKLAGITEILNYQYCLGDFEGYQRYIEQALSLIKALIGTSPVRFQGLHGSETIDIQVFVWYDVFSSIATSRPTRLVYDCNAEELLRQNQEGPNRAGVGLEWITGISDALLMLTMQIINLRQSQHPPAERVTQAARIEAALRSWKVWPSSTTNSIMKIQRASAQEIWRHFAILYLYQVIHNASPTNEVVRQSVKEIIQVATTLRAGHNPDCLLCTPYFIAGTFAISARQRRFLKARILACGMVGYAIRLANGLERIWSSMEGAGDYLDWTTMSPPVVVMF